MPERMSQIRTRGQRAISSAGRVIGVVVWFVFLACWWLNGFAIDYRFDAADASQALNSSSMKSASSRSATLVHSSPQSNALSQAIYQNTPGNSQGQALGLSWDTGTSVPDTPAPSGWSALTAWAVVYQEAGAAVSPNNASDTVQVQGFQTYVHLTNGAWVEVQNQATSGLSGANYIADFSNDTSTPFTTDQKNSDGSVTFNAPPAGYNDHFWPSGARNFRGRNDRWRLCRSADEDQRS